MFDLETAIATWRRFFAYRRGFLKEDLDELERHLRDHVIDAVARGMPEEEAFQAAVAAIGDYEGAEDEYQKVYWDKLQRQRRLADEFKWKVTMLKSYLVIALRGLRQRKLYTAINVAGLAVGLACCLLLALYLQHELRYDRFHAKAERIYRIVSDWETPSEKRRIMSPGALAPALQADFPEVLEVVRTAPARHLVAKGDRQFQEDGMLYADASLFRVFDFELLKGDAKTALAGPDRIVLTASTARKYFGDQDPVGESITIDRDRAMTVTGVVADVPSNSHLRFDALISMDTYEAWQAWRFKTFVSGINFSTYLLLPEGYDAAALAAKLPAFVERHTKQAFAEMDLAENRLTYVLEPLTELYFMEPREGEPRPAGERANLYLFGSIGVFILLIACVNFVNLATARSVERAKEVGVRKVSGAQRTGLIAQFLTEFVLLSFFAAVVAVLLAAAVLPLFRSFSGVALPEIRFGLQALFGTALLAFGVGVLAGLYPAVVLSGFRPAVVLKGTFATSRHGVVLRKGLVLFQFAISAGLIIGTGAVFSQLRYLRSQDLGFNQEQMLVIDFHGDGVVWENVERVKRQLAAHPAVVGAAASGYVPNGGFDTFGREMETGSGARQNVSLKTYDVDYDFLPLFGIALLAGRNFSPDYPADSTQALVVNEAAARHLGFATPQDAVGAAWRFGPEGAPGTVIGVVEDFNFESLRNRVEPLALQFLRFQARYITLRLQTDHLSETLAELEQIWTAAVPHRPFDYGFLDDAFAAQYQADERFGKLFGIFAALAVFIACLGLFGLAAYTVRQRTKEIGVRKVLGASVPDLVVLLSKDFAWLVLGAFLVAAPVAYLGLRRWLDGFAYRVDVGPGLFLLAGAVVLAVAMATVSVQAIRAALNDPVKALRYE